MEVFQLASETGRAAALSTRPLAAGLFALGSNDGGYLPPSATEEQRAEYRAARLAAQWKRITQQPAYKWLLSRREYARAWQIFQRKKTYRSSAKLRADDADFKFVHAVVWSLMVFLDQSDPSRRRRFPSKRTAVATRRYVKKLLAADLELLTLDVKIRSALETLDRQLAEVVATRKVAENKSYAQRRFVTCLVHWFCTELGDTLFTAVRELCGLVDYGVSDAALHPQVRAVRRRWAQALARALTKSAKTA